MSEQNSIVLMGCKHCGKSTHGKNLAQKLQVPFFDTDTVLEQIVGMSFREYYKTAGVAKFMEAEETACRKIITENQGKTIVVATGGGICDNPPALNQLRVLGKFIFLELDLEYSVARVLSKIHWDENEKNWANAPAYIQQANPHNMEEINKILLKKYTERFRQYREIADLTVPLKNQEVTKNFELILKALNQQ